MAAEKATVSKQTLYLTIFVVFIAGFLSGVGFSVYRTGGTTDVPGQGPGSQSNMNRQEAQAIASLEAEVTQNPENYNAWIQLGHLYFDSNKYLNAIGAYEKALELHSGSANLLTDLGVMYRRAGDSLKALESFDKALAMDPGHQPSRLNKGIVLHFDLGRTDEAIAVWRSVLALNPEARMANGVPLNEFIEQIISQAPKSN